MKLKELRKYIGLTQPEAAKFLGISFRTYCRYEAEPKYEDGFKYKQMVSLLNEKANTLVLKIDAIKNRISPILQKHNVSACYLFGSYAKGKAASKSDIDLMIVSEIEGIKYYQLLGELEEVLKKKVDLIRLQAAIQNFRLLSEILKDGIKIYN